MPAQPGAVATGALDRPGPQRGVVVGELHQLGIARAAIAATVISPRTPRVALSMTAAEWVWTWVSTPMTTSTTSRRSVRLFMRSLLRRTGRGSGPGRRLGRTVMRHIRRSQRQVVKLLIRPAPPTGPGSATTSGQVAARHESQSFRGSHPRSPTHSPSPSGCVGDPHSLSAAKGAQVRGHPQEAGPKAALTDAPLTRVGGS